MSFDPELDRATVHLSIRYARCATCGEKIRARTCAGTTGAIEWAHLQPFDSYDATLCVVDYPNNRARPDTERNQP